MSSSNQPPRKLPREIYIRRRVAAFVIIVVVVLVLLWGLSALGGKNRDSSNTAAQSETQNSAPLEENSASDDKTSAAATTTASAADSEKDAGQERAQPTPAVEIDPALAEKKSCELSDLVIVASSDNTTYPIGVQPTFGMTVINPTGADCKINLDEEKLRFEVYSLTDNSRVWSDIDCYPSVQEGTYTFPAGEQRSFDALWSRLRSNRDGNCSNREPAPAGSYFLHTVIGDNASEPYTFNLQ